MSGVNPLNLVQKNGHASQKATSGGTIAKMILRIIKRVVLVLDRIMVGAGALSSAAILVIMFAVTADVLSRKLLNKPIAGVFEGSEMLMVLVVFLALALNESRRQNIRVDVLTRRLGTRGQVPLDLLAYLVGLFLFIAIAYGSFQNALVSLSKREYTGGIISLPMYPARFVVSIGSLLLASQFLVVSLVYD